MSQSIKEKIKPILEKIKNGCEKLSLRIKEVLKVIKKWFAAL